MLGGTPAQDPLSQVVPGNDDMGGDRDAIVAQIAQLIEHPDPTQKPLWDGSGLPETAAEMQELDMEDLARKAGDEEAALQPKVDSLARGKSVCPKPKQFVLGGRGALGLIPDASWGGGKAAV